MSESKTTTLTFLIGTIIGFIVGYATSGLYFWLMGGVEKCLIP